jgi:hypothetical protein
MECGQLQGESSHWLLRKMNALQVEMATSNLDRLLLFGQTECIRTWHAYKQVHRRTASPQHVQLLPTTVRMHGSHHQGCPKVWLPGGGIVSEHPALSYAKRCVERRMQVLADNSSILKRSPAVAPGRG